MIQGAFVSARRDAVVAVRFDERPSGYALDEEEEFSYRLSRRGRVLYLSEAVVVYRKISFISRDLHAFRRTVIVKQAYLFRNYFRLALLARLEFALPALLLFLLLAHQLAGPKWAGTLRLVEGAVQALPRRLGEAS
jgi:hypothetical protein